MVPRRAPLLAFLAAFLLAPAARAQSPESIPRDLAAALMAWRPGEPIAFHVGASPPGLEVDWPEGTRVLGGVEREGGTRAVAAVVPLSPAVAWEAIAEGMEASGWSRVERPGLRQGFVPEARSGDFCHPEGRRRSLPPPATRDGGSLVVVQDGPALDSLCDETALERGVRLFEDVLPRLVMPDGRAWLVGGSATTSSASAHSSARYDGASGAGELLERFGAELARNGWRRLSTDLAGGTGVSRWAFEYGGDPWTGTLVVIEATEEASGYLSLQAWSREPASRPGD